MSLIIPGFNSSQIFLAIDEIIKQNGPKLLEKVNGIFHFQISKGEEKKSWTVDLKNGKVSIGKPSNPNVTLSMNDDDCVKIMTGQLDSTEAFFNGQLSIDGDMEMAMKLKLIQPEEGLLKKTLNEEKKKKNETQKNDESSIQVVEGYKVSQIFKNIEQLLELNGKKLVEKMNGIYQFNIQNESKGIQSWTLDLRNSPGKIRIGPSTEKPNVILEASDDDFYSIMTGTLVESN